MNRAEVDEANDDFRRALFVDGSDRVVRYLYVRSLLQAGRRGLARAQLVELRAQLDATPSDVLLEDGETRAAELREEVESLMESLE